MLVVLLFLIPLSTLADPSPPIWPSSFHQAFSQSYSTTPHHVLGKIYYNSTTNLMRVDRSDGQYDMFCSSVLPNVSTPCIFIMRDKKRYILYPEKRICCYCCDDSHGCGMPPPDFLSGTNYEGYQVLGSQSFYKWRYTSGGLFYYDSPDQKRIPRRFANDNKTITDLIINTFSTQQVPEATYTLPNYCQNLTCPMTSICGKLQKKEQIFVSQ